MKSNGSSTALFADTFYWIALTDPNDTAHQDALAMTAERAAAPLITTDEVLGEYSAFFANAPGRCAVKPAAMCGTCWKAPPCAWPHRAVIRS